MRVIPLAPYPLKQTFDRFEAAIEGALRHPLQEKAWADTAKLRGAALIDACWTDADFLLRFSNEWTLHVYLEGDSVAWNASNRAHERNEAAIERVGSPPVLCRWPAGIGDHVLDRSALISKRGGSVLEKLFANELGLLVYCRGHSILWFQAACRTDSESAFLWLWEGG